MISTMRAPRSPLFRVASLVAFGLFTLVLLWNFVPESAVGHIKHLQTSLLHDTEKQQYHQPSQAVSHLEPTPAYLAPSSSASSASSSEPTTPSFSHPHGSGTSSDHTSDHTSDQQSDTVSKPWYNSADHPSVNSLWYKWSQIMYDTRPTASKITLKKDAPNNGVHDKDSNPRFPYENLVKNSPSELRSMENSHAAFMKELKAFDNATNPFDGTGVVLVGGDQYYGPAITTINMLRRTGCNLPVEVFVKNQTEYESYVCETYFPKIGARCLVVTDFLDKGSHVFEAGHYQLKVLALLFSSFRHVLFLDSDSMPLLNPLKEMIEVEPYTTTGMVVWPDFWSSTESPHFYEIAGLSEFPPNLPKTSSESGQILLDKGTHLESLLLATYYNIYGPDYFYPLLSQGAMGQGDKETFMAAAVVMNQPYYRVRHPVEAVMNDDGAKTRGRAMLQYHGADEKEVVEVIGHPLSSTANKHKGVRPAFLHANLPKMNAGHLLDEGDLYSEVDTTKRWRLLGDREKQIRMFGYDIEAAIWDIMVETGCSELNVNLKDWRDRKNMCKRLHEHYEELFGGQNAPKTQRPEVKEPAAKESTDPYEDEAPSLSSESVHTSKPHTHPDSVEDSLGFSSHSTHSTKQHSSSDSKGDYHDETVSKLSSTSLSGSPGEVDSKSPW